MFEVKVPINFLGTAGFWLRTEGHYLFATWYSGLAKEIISNPVEHNLSADPGMVIACAMRNLYLFQLAFYGRGLAASDLPPTRMHHRSQEGDQLAVSLDIAADCATVTCSTRKPPGSLEIRIRCFFFGKKRYVHTVPHSQPSLALLPTTRSFHIHLQNANAKAWYLVYNFPQDSFHSSLPPRFCLLITLPLTSLNFQHLNTQ